MFHVLSRWILPRYLFTANDPAIASMGVLKRVGEDMYSMRYFNALTSLAVSSIMVEAATLFSLPLSSTQALTSSVFGAGLSYRYKALFLKPYLIVVLTWVISPVTGLIVGYLI